MESLGLAGSQVAAVATMIGLFAFAVWYGASRSEARVRRERREDEVDRAP